MANSWKIKPPFPGAGTVGAFSFTIGNKAYVGGGWDNYNGTILHNFYEFDPAADSGRGLWTEKALFPGTPRMYAGSFAINTLFVKKGYVCCGMNYTDDSNWSLLKDVWEYTPGLLPSDLGSWVRKKDFLAGKVNAVKGTRSGPSGFSIGNNGYLGFGVSELISTPTFWSATYEKDLWAYNPVTDEWTVKDSIPVNGERATAVAIVIDDVGYVGGGDNPGRNLNDFWKFNPTASTGNQWSPQTAIPLPPPVAPDTTQRITASIGFSIDHKGYIGTGRVNLHWDPDSVLNSFYQFMPDAGLGVWTNIPTPFSEPAGAAGRDGGFAFAINNKGYAGGGENFDEYTTFNDFWVYDSGTVIPTALQIKHAIVAAMKKLKKRKSIRHLFHKP